MAKSEPKTSRKEERRERKDGMCGSKRSDGVRFPVPDHHGIHESENKPKAP